MYKIKISLMSKDEKGFLERHKLTHVLIYRVVPVTPLPPKHLINQHKMKPLDSRFI